MEPPLPLGELVDTSLVLVHVPPLEVQVEVEVEGGRMLQGRLAAPLEGVGLHGRVVGAGRGGERHARAPQVGRC